jgi:Transposase DDE domain group 1
MKNDPVSDANKTTGTEITPLFGSAKILLEQTPKAVTPFGGLSSFVAFLQQIGFATQIQKALPFPAPTSPNAIPLAHTLTAFIMAVLTGASRFAHTDWLRADRALHALLGILRFPGTDTVRNFFLRFTQAHIQSFWRPLWRWLLAMLSCPKEGLHLDLDSTVFQRAGTQEGAAKGYNPRRRGRKSHHPLLAVLAEHHFFLHGWLRSGNSGVARGVVAFLQEALALLPEGMRIGCVRADSGFFEEPLLHFLEEKKLSYVVVARLTCSLKRRCAGIKDWTLLDENYAAGEFQAQLLGWSKARRFIVIRERVREEKEAVGRKLLDVPGYTFRVWVTDRSDGVVELWQEYNGRATVEQRIEELKNDLAADGFCMQEFFCTEAAFLAVLFTFNLLSLYQQMTTPEQAYRQPATLRTQVFIAGAILGQAGKELVLRLSEACGGLAKHKPLLEAILQWPSLTSPKLLHPSDRMAIGGGFI